jgi:hypothetical protein
VKNDNNNQKSSIKETEENYTYDKPKSGGANSPGELGGVYKLGKDKYLVKQDTKNGKLRSNKVIAEYVANKVFNDMYPSMGPEISLVKSDSLSGHPSAQSNYSATTEPDKNIYLSVKYFENYKDIYQDLAEVLGKVEPSSRKRASEALNGSDMSKGIREAQNKGNPYNNIYEVIAGSLLLNDFSIHSGNIGVINEGDKKRAVRIDFGAALKGMTDEVMYDKKISDKVVFNKNYFKRDFDKDVKLNQKFADALFGVSEKNLMENFKKSIDDCNELFSLDALKKFALDSRFANRNEVERINNENRKELLDVVNKNAEKIFENRKQSLRNYSSNIELELLVRDSIKNNKGELDKDKLSSIVEKNKNYFVDVAMGLKKIKFMHGRNINKIPEINSYLENKLQSDTEFKENGLTSGLNRAVEKYFKNKNDNQLSKKELSDEMSRFMRINGLSKKVISDKKLSKICDNTSKEIFKAKEKGVGFLDKCKDLLKGFIFSIIKRQKPKKEINEISADLIKQAIGIVSNSKNILSDRPNNISNNIPSLKERIIFTR